MDGPDPQTESPDGPPEPPPPDNGPLIRRLFVSLLLSSAAALACWLLAPRLGLDLPWYVPLLAFAVILVAAILPLFSTSEPDQPNT